MPDLHKARAFCNCTSYRKCIIIFKNSVPTSKKRARVFYADHLVEFWGNALLIMYTENHLKQINVVYGQNVKLLNIKHFFNIIPTTELQGFKMLHSQVNLL
jgi:hypothetical protein